MLDFLLMVALVVAGGRGHDDVGACRVQAAITITSLLERNRSGWMFVRGEKAQKGRESSDKVAHWKKIQTAAESGKDKQEMKTHVRIHVPSSRAPICSDYSTIKQWNGGPRDQPQTIMAA